MKKNPRKEKPEKKSIKTEKSHSLEKNAVKKEKTQTELKKINLFSNPILSCYYLLKILQRFLKSFFIFLSKYWMVFLLLVAIAFIPRNIQGPHQQVLLFH